MIIKNGNRRPKPVLKYLLSAETARKYHKKISSGYTTINNIKYIDLPKEIKDTFTKGNYVFSFLSVRNKKTDEILLSVYSVPYESVIKIEKYNSTVKVILNPDYNFNKDINSSTNPAISLKEIKKHISFVNSHVKCAYTNAIENLSTGYYHITIDQKSYVIKVDKDPVLNTKLYYLYTCNDPSIAGIDIQY